MVKFNDFLKNLKGLTNFEIVLFIVLILYLVSNVSTPYELAQYSNNTYTYLSLVIITIILFLYSNPLLAILFGIVSIVFVNRSSLVDPVNIKPSQVNKDKKLNDLNNNLNEKTLEEEIVGNIVKQPMNINGPEEYHPVTCELHNASNI